MAQIAIPVLLVGVAYLISNEKNEEENDKECKESFSELYSQEKNDKKVYPNIPSYVNKLNNEEKLSQHQDKYFLNKNQELNPNDEFKTLAGNSINISDLNHNNMNFFYGSKTNENTNLDQSSLLDLYTGQGTYDIQKDETAPLFKPEDNMHNVYGCQNQNDFMQSRVNASLRHANTKPWEEIKVTPGIGMKADEKCSVGLNNYNMNRDLYKPKNVDELRTINNQKQVYSLDNHMGPAITQSIKNQGIQGKMVKKLPDLTYSNDNNLGMIAGTSGPNYQMQKSHQMMTNENRDSTSIEYYGARGSSHDQVNYVNGTYMEPHKQQLCSQGPSNMTNQGVNPTNSMNYGKDSYTTLHNNRTTTKNSRFGNVGGLVSNMVDPIVKGLRHSKKTNCVSNSNPIGNMNGANKQPMVYNPNENVSTTNREMYEGKLNMKHLNVQNQDSTAYMNTRPLLNITQRNSMNTDQTGPAQSANLAKKNYQAQYNQRNNNRLYSKNVTSHSNMNLFNNKVNMIEKNKELCNNRQTPYYDPQSSTLDNPIELLGSFTSLPQSYENINENNLDSSLLKAFKQNPYTQSLQSIA